MFFFCIIRMARVSLTTKTTMFFNLCLHAEHFIMTPSLSQHRSLQPTGPPTQGPSQQHSHARLNESFEAIRQEFDILTSDIAVLRNQRDDYDSKGT
jgi:hypothetical protein